MRNMKTNYRLYQETDTRDLICLMRDLGYPVEEIDFKKTIKEIIKREGTIFIAETENRIIGSACAVIDVRLAEGISGEIVSLVVSKDFRGFGVGRKLIDISEEWICKKVNKIRIRANVIRTDAHDFYTHLGYKEKKQQKVFIKKMS